MPAAAGVDVGATLAKIAARRGPGPPGFRLLSASAPDEIARAVVALAPATLGLCGCGAGDVAERLPRDAVRVPEFDAWGLGAAELLRHEEAPAPEPVLLASVGTGTSILLVEGGRARRLGGTALGGGALVGLGRAMLGTGAFEDLARLARQGDRRRVDLLVSDIYRGGSPLPGHLTAASLGKLAREGGGGLPTPPGDERTRADLAHAATGLVGENVALLCAALATAAGAKSILFAGSTLRANPALVSILCDVAGAASGLPATALRDGEFSGALGALLYAAR